MVKRQLAVAQVQGEGAAEGRRRRAVARRQARVRGVPGPLQHAVLAGQAIGKLQASDGEGGGAATWVHVQTLGVGGIVELDGVDELQRRAPLEALRGGERLIAEAELEVAAVVDGEVRRDGDGLPGCVHRLDREGHWVTGQAGGGVKRAATDGLWGLKRANMFKYQYMRSCDSIVSINTSAHCPGF